MGLQKFNASGLGAAGASDCAGRRLGGVGDVADVGRCLAETPIMCLSGRSRMWGFDAYAM